MSEDIKGVFVRLPLSEEQVESVLNSYTGDKESTNICMQKTILDLGTPVTGKALDCAVIIEQDDKRYMPEVVSYQPHLVKPKQLLTLARQSDAQAHIAAIEAEAVRLRGVLTEIAESDDTDNALDPERNKRVAREVLKGGAA